MSSIRCQEFGFHESSRILKTFVARRTVLFQLRNVLIFVHIILSYGYFLLDTICCCVCVVHFTGC